MPKGLLFKQLLQTETKLKLVTFGSYFDEFVKNIINASCTRRTKPAAFLTIFPHVAKFRIAVFTQATHPQFASLYRSRILLQRIPKISGKNSFF